MWSVAAEPSKLFCKGQGVSKGVDTAKEAPIFGAERISVSCTLFTARRIFLTLLSVVLIRSSIFRSSIQPRGQSDSTRYLHSFKRYPLSRGIVEFSCACSHWTLS